MALHDDKINNSNKFGKLLASPTKGYEVVISGISGRYPESSNVAQFGQNLFSKLDMSTDDDRRWKSGHPEIPPRSGKIPDIELFDAGFFGYNHRQATQLDPICRLFLEVAIEALFDAGIHPSELEGTRTGVFVGDCFSESEQYWYMEKLVPKGFAILGNLHVMVANHLSNFLKLKGPSVICDTACSSSLYALENAYKAIRTGLCDTAIVGGTNLCLQPYFTLQFARLGVLSPNGQCRPFDVDGKGYMRSETISAVILQKSMDAKRIYSTVMHVKTNCDGFKDSGITYPSGEVQVQLFEDFYKECDSVKPRDLIFLEAHGTGTQVGDPEEMQAIDQVFTKDRQTSLLVGSVKSNIGHTEPSAGLCSITKAIIAFESGIIPPNINYVTPRPEIKGIHEGRLKVVTENTLLTADQNLIGINAFGFGGGNAHVLLKRNQIQKNDKGIAKDNIPRLVCVSGRTSDAIHVLLNDVIANNVDVEQIRLLQEIFRLNVPGHLYRGYTLASKTGEISRSSCEYKNSTANLVLCFGNISEDKIKNANKFLEVPIAVSTVQGIHEILGPKGLNILSILYNSTYNSVLEIMMVHFTLQILIANLIKSCSIVPIKIYGTSKGFSLGALVSAYFNGHLTLQEATEYAYHIAFSVQSITNEEIKTKEIMGLKENNKIATKLHTNLMEVLSKTEILNKPKGLNDSCFNIETFFDNCFEKINTKTILKNEWAFLEIGDGEVSQILQKEINSLNKKNVIRCDGGVNSILASFGRLYEIGFNPQIQNLYPTVDFPVSRGTPMLSPSIKWNHDRKWFVVKFESNLIGIEENTTKFMINRDTVYLTGHVVNGRNLVPATAYLHWAWTALADILGYIREDMTVVFENCKFIRATSMPKQETILELTVQIQIVSGNFEVIEGGETVVSGRIYHLRNNESVLEDYQQPSVDTGETPYMNRKDVYKVLRLRGYNYRDKFQAIHSCDSSAQLGSIKWDGNWVTFIDNMLQMKILGEDTKLLYVPIGIQRLVIDASRHNSYIKAFDEETPILPVTVAKESGIIRSGYVEIRGLLASSIAKQKYKGTPVIEKYIFVPNVTSLSTEQAIRSNMQILLENLLSFKVKVVELIDDATFSEKLSLAEIISNVFGDQPAIQPDITVLTKNNLNIPNVKVEDKKLLTEVDCSLVVGSKILQRSNILQLAFCSLIENGFLLSREALDFNADSNYYNKDVNIITIFTTDEEKLVFFRKRTDFIDSSLIKISSKDAEFSWVAKLQYEIAQNKNVVIYVEGEPLNGVLGMVLCLRREMGGQNIRLVSLLDSTQGFNINLPFYREQLSKNLAINIYKNKQWGTYRHLLLENTNLVEAEHCYLNSLRRGDLSSLTWIEGPLSINKKVDAGKTLVHIYYSAINFRDVMTAMGKINADSVTRNRREQECVQGLEFSGLTGSGERVMGIVKCGASASLVAVENHMLWKVPESWTLNQAVTVPIVYATCILALFEQGKIHPGCSVLIHSGAGGVGLAAIQIAFHVGCTVYTTVGTLEKRQFLLNRFPKLKDHHISTSRSVDFENHIMISTKGRGVDIVLNSLAEEKLIASVRCLARGGRFLEIGKFDLANNNTLQLMILQKEASFHGIMLDAYIDQGPDRQMFIYKLLQHFLDIGVVIPLPETMYKINEEEAAFRYMTTGKHIGKVIIQIREEMESSLEMKFPCIPRYYCDPEKTYIICGGLGGFGLELADWLVLRGCKNLVLTSRTGVKTGYQAYKLSIWKSYGCTVEISTEDITTYEGCINLIKTSSKLGPIHAIFNLAVILKDALFENQSAESFKICFGPKANATQHLDTTTRNLCPDLRDFVIFSSVSCGRGNAGQTNYGMANAVMEKICEKRKNDGLPALAIEWGAVGDVGLVADMQEESVEMEIGGTLQQNISNCLEVMDILLKQNEAAIVSSMIVAEKKSSFGGSDSIVDTVAAILGIKDLKSIPLQASLTEIGMDSMTAVEIKQTLDREHDVFLSAQDLKQLTFAKLLEIQAKKESDKSIETDAKKEDRVDEMDILFQHIPGEEMCESNIVVIQQIADNFDSTVVFLPGIESLIKSLEPLYQNTMANLVGIQYPYSEQGETIEETALAILPAIEERIPKIQPFNLVCHSFGCFVGLRIANLLEQKGYCGTIICIDGAPNYLKAVLRMMDIESEEFQVKFLVHLAGKRCSYELNREHLKALYKCNSFDERIRLFQTVTPLDVEGAYSADHQRICILNIYKRLKAMVSWEPSFKLQSKVIYFKATVLVGAEIPDEELGLSNLCESPVDVEVYEGNHSSMLKNPEVAQAVNEFLGLT